MSACALYPEAYGVSVRTELRDRMARAVTLSTVHVALHRLEEKGYLKSHFGPSTGRRGGKPRRLFEPTTYAIKVLKEAREAREEFWKAIPGVVLNKT